MPVDSFDIFNSLSEQSIPKDSTPRILATSSFILFFGIIAPGGANTVIKLFLALLAPHTTLTVSRPTLTSQILSLSAFGCFETFKICATLKRFKFLLGFVMLSTSSPIFVKTSDM